MDKCHKLFIDNCDFKHLTFNYFSINDNLLLCKIIVALLIKEILETYEEKFNNRSLLSLLLTLSACAPKEDNDSTDHHSNGVNAPKHAKNLTESDIFTSNKENQN